MRNIIRMGMLRLLFRLATVSFLCLPMWIIAFVGGEEKQYRMPTIAFARSHVLHANLFSTFVSRRKIELGQNSIMTRFLFYLHFQRLPVKRWRTLICILHNSYSTQLIADFSKIITFTFVTFKILFFFITYFLKFICWLLGNCFYKLSYLT